MKLEFFSTVARIVDTSDESPSVPLRNRERSYGSKMQVEMT